MTGFYNELGVRAPGRTPFVAKCCRGTQDSLFVELNTGECSTLHFMTGVHPGNALAPSPFCMLVDPGLRKMLECYHSLGFGTFADVGGIFFAFRQLSPETVAGIPFVCKLPLRDGHVSRASYLLQRGIYLPLLTPPCYNTKRPSAWFHMKR